MYTSVDTVKLVLSSDPDEVGGTAADLSPAQVEHEINAADAIIDANLRVVYKIPFNPVPYLIQSISTDLAAYGCDLNYRSSREYDSQNMPIILRYNRANQALQQLRLGTLTLSDERDLISKDGAEVVHQYDGLLFDFPSVFGYRAGW